MRFCLAEMAGSRKGFGAGFGFEFRDSGALRVLHRKVFQVTLLRTLSIIVAIQQSSGGEVFDVYWRVVVGGGRGLEWKSDFGEAWDLGLRKER
ncbi:NPL4-like protein 2 [Pyrus ussuriensis x Pyrus communis]|uniref:NPL4-like protein 2 n=1 Tax=Pyrus ussuriensis x Pyrus communis TaxID=2448454 RepID=A0A5N5I849_9ROSA|nr:NPL4-like protein 2 [Pyrus ussuriensis x Pyrus communis]